MSTALNASPLTNSRVGNCRLHVATLVARLRCVGCLNKNELLAIHLGFVCQDAKKSTPRRTRYLASLFAVVGHWFPGLCRFFLAPLPVHHGFDGEFFCDKHIVFAYKMPCELVLDVAPAALFLGVGGSKPLACLVPVAAALCLSGQPPCKACNVLFTFFVEFVALVFFSCVGDKEVPKIQVKAGDFASLGKRSNSVRINLAKQGHIASTVPVHRDGGAGDAPLVWTMDGGFDPAELEQLYPAARRINFNRMNCLVAPAACSAAFVTRWPQFGAFASARKGLDEVTGSTRQVPERLLVARGVAKGEEVVFSPPAGNPVSHFLIGRPVAMRFMDSLAHGERLVPNEPYVPKHLRQQFKLPLIREDFVLEGDFHERNFTSRHQQKQVKLLCGRWRGMIVSVASRMRHCIPIAKARGFSGVKCDNRGKSSNAVLGLRQTKVESEEEMDNFEVLSDGRRSVIYDGKRYFKTILGDGCILVSAYMSTDGEFLGECAAVGAMAVAIANKTSAETLRFAAQYLGGDLSVKAAALAQELDLCDPTAPSSGEDWRLSVLG